MNKRWLLILLLISAAFNLAVLGSFVYLRGFHPRHHHSPQREWRDKDRWPGKIPSRSGSRICLWRQHPRSQTRL